MRPGVYGREIHYDSEGEFVALNLGVNFYLEHEKGTETTVRNINTNFFYCCTEETLADFMRLNKLVKKAEQRQNKRIKKQGTIGKYIVDPKAQCFTSTIIIDNTAIQKKYTNFLFCDGEYVMFTIGGALNSEFWKNIFITKKVFSEEELLNMRDYSNKSMIYNPGYNKHIMQHNEINENAENKIVGSWANDGFVLYFRNENNEGDALINSLKKVHHDGNLAVLPNMPKSFSKIHSLNGRGCWLVDVSKLHICFEDELVSRVF